MRGSEPDVAVYPVMKSYESVVDISTLRVVSMFARFSRDIGVKPLPKRHGDTSLRSLTQWTSEFIVGNDEIYRAGA